MNKILLIVSLTITTFFFIQCHKTTENHNNHHQQNVDTEQMLMKMEKEWGEVFISRDVSVLERLLAPDLVYHQGDDGKLSNKQDQINGIINDPNKYKSADVNDMSVKMYGSDLAVVTGDARWIGHDTEGKEFDSQSRWTNVWLKRQGRWQCIAGHGNPVNDK